MASRFAVSLRRSVVVSAAVVVVLLAASAFSAEAAQKEFDFFTLALQWPATVCQRTKCCGGIEVPSDMFTIRGLWPDYNDGTWPKCCGNVGHDESQVESLLPAINKYWPSLSCDSPVLCNGETGPLWAREWETHGTCAYPVIRNEFNYFATALYLYSKYDMTEILERAGVVPSQNNLYSRRNITATIENEFGATPLLRCPRASRSLQEVRVCFDKDLKPQNCAADSSSSCPLLVRLPKYATTSGIAEVTDGESA